MSFRRCAVACLVLGLAAAEPPHLLAQSAPPDPRVALPERPTVATHAHTIAVGYVELETGIQGYRAGGGGTEYDSPSLVKFGLASHLQLDVFEAVTDLSQSGQSTLGIGDISAGLKWRLLDGAPVVGDLAVQSTAKFATGSAAKGTGSGTTDLNVILISSHEFGPVSLDVNVGFTDRSGDESVVPNQATMWTASFGLPVQGLIGWAAEIFGYPGTTGPTGARPIVGFLTGPTFTVRRYLVIDCGAILRIAGDQSNTLYAGLTWNIGRMTPSRGGNSRLR